MEKTQNVFYAVRDFSGGLAAVRVNSLWGYIDPGGRLYLPADYVSASRFLGGLAAVSLPVPGTAGNENLWIDRDGAAVYRSVAPAGDGLDIIVSSSGAYGFAGGTGSIAAPRFEAVAGCASGLCLVKKDGRQVFVDYAGVPVLETDYDEAASLGCGLYRIKKAGRYGLAGSTGAIIAQPLYDLIKGSGCEAGLAAALFGIEGRLDSFSGEFASGLSPQAPAPVKPGEKCLSIAKSLTSMRYQDIPGYCRPDELRSLLITYPGCLNCRLALAEIYSSTAAGKGPADLKGALEALAGAIRISSEPARLYQRHIDLLLSAPTSYVDAAALLEDYQRLIRLEPYKPEHYSDICRAYAFLKEPPADMLRSSYYCDLAVKMGDDGAYNLISRANFRRLTGDPAGALADLKAVIDMDPKDKEARLARAKLSMALGQDFRAVFDCSKLLENDASDADALEARAMAYMRMGMCDKAQADLKASGRLRPGPGNLHKTAVYRWLCERDIPGTLEIISELLTPSEACGGSCWRPREYEQYLGDLYGTGQYAALLNKYPVTGAPEAAAGPPVSALPADPAVSSPAPVKPEASADRGGGSGAEDATGAPDAALPGLKPSVSVPAAQEGGGG